MRPIIITLLLCSGMALSACGQKGPLSLPEPATEGTTGGQESEEQKN